MEICNKIENDALLSLLKKVKNANNVACSHTKFRASYLLAINQVCTGVFCLCELFSLTPVTKAEDLNVHCVCKTSYGGQLLFHLKF